MKLRYEIGNEFPLMWINDSKKFITELTALQFKEEVLPTEIIIEIYRQGTKQSSRTFQYKEERILRSVQLPQKEIYFWVYRSGEFTLELYEH